MKNKLDYFIEGQLIDCIRQIEETLATNILSIPSRPQNPFFKAAFIETLINLRNLMYHAENTFCKRVSFDNDMLKTERIKDVTDLIKYIRDAACHPESEKYMVDTSRYPYSGRIKLGLNTIWGVGKLITINGVSVHENPYVDDLLFCYGSHGIYLKRHIIRAYLESKSIVEEGLAVIRLNRAL